MNQNVWGPHAWFLLHSITFNYPFKPSEEQKQRTKAFFYDMQHMLPCSYCRGNYKRNLKETPIRLNSRKELVEWLIDLHNEVNGQTGKKALSYDQVIRIYEDAYQKKLPLTEHENELYGGNGKKGYDWRLPLLIVGGVGLLYLAYRYVRKRK